MYDVKVLLEMNLNPETNYLTVGKTYTGVLLITYGMLSLMEICDDFGDMCLILAGTDCSHIHCDGWKIIEEE